MVCEPVHRFELGFPADTLGTVYSALAAWAPWWRRRRCTGSWATATGEIPAARMLELQQQLRGLTRGEGVLEAEFDHYEPVGAGLARS